MKVIQIISILVLLAFAPFATAAPFLAWGNCEDGGYCVGFAVDINHVTQWAKDTFRTEHEVYYEEAVSLMYNQQVGELYAGVSGTPDIPYAVDAETTKAYRWNPWAVGVAIVGAIGGAVAIALLTKGNSESSDGTSINADNGSTVYVYEDGASDSHNETTAGQ